MTKTQLILLLQTMEHRYPTILYQTVRAILLIRLRRLKCLSVEDAMSTKEPHLKLLRCKLSIVKTVVQQQLVVLRQIWWWQAILLDVKGRRLLSELTNMFKLTRFIQSLCPRNWFEPIKCLTNECVDKWIIIFRLQYCFDFTLKLLII